MKSSNKAKITIQSNYNLLLAKIEKNKAIYGKTDISNMKVIATLYRDYPRNFTRMLETNNKYNEIVNWIYAKTNFLQDSAKFIYSLATRLNWIFNGKNMENNKCGNPLCGKHCGLNKMLRLNDDFPMHCSTKCSTSNKETIQKSKQTRLERYGDENFVNTEKLKQTIQIHLVEDPDYWKRREEKAKQTKISNGHDPNWNNRTKACKTLKEHVESDPKFRDEITAKAKATKLKHFGDENYVNVEKSWQTRLERYGKWEDDSAMVRRAKTCLERYGVRTKIGNKDIQQKIRKTFIDKYGVDSPTKVQSIQRKIKETNISRYGTEHPWENQQIRAKIKQTNIKKYGNAIGQQTHTYVYENMSFDSSWELALWIYCKDNNIDIKKNPCTFSYEHNGKQHLYLVDFAINGLLIEIKGDQFFKEDGSMQNPFDHSLDELYEAKHQCMLKNNVKILRHNDIIKYMKYVEDKYGKKYLDIFKSE